MNAAAVFFFPLLLFSPFSCVGDPRGCSGKGGARFQQNPERRQEAQEAIPTPHHRKTETEQLHRSALEDAHRYPCVSVARISRAGGLRENLPARIRVPSTGRTRWKTHDGQAHLLVQ